MAKMTFRVDKHGQLRITVYSDLTFGDPKEPDTLVFTADQTEELAEFMKNTKNNLSIRGNNADIRI